MMIEVSQLSESHVQRASDAGWYANTDPGAKRPAAEDTSAIGGV
jgi:hypothetical protein